MNFADPIGDMLTRIRNAQMRRMSKVVIPNSKFRAKILDVLKQEGYISDYKVLSEKDKGNLTIDLKYNNGVLENIYIPSGANVKTITELDWAMADSPQGKKL